MSLRQSNIRVLLTKSLLDGHDRGVRYLAQKLMEAGIDVIFTRYRISNEIVKSAIEEDVDVIGISFSTASPLVVTSDVMKLIREIKLEDMLVIVGGIIPDDEVPELTRIGVGKTFGPGSYAGDIIGYIKEVCQAKRRRWDSNVGYQ